MATKLVLRPHF